MTKRREALEKRAGLILELYKAAPDHNERIPDLMVERWNDSWVRSQAVRG